MIFHRHPQLSRQPTTGKIIGYIAIIITLFLFGFLLLNRTASVSPFVTRPFFWSSVGATSPPDGSLCGNYVPEPVPGWDEMVASPPPVPRGIAVSILEGDLKPVGYRTFLVAADRMLPLQFHIWYPKTQENSQSLNLKIMIIVDEKQVSGAFPNQNTLLAQPQDYVDLNFMPGDNKTIQVQIPPLEAGIHNVIVLVLDNVNFEPDTRGNLAFSAIRHTFVAGSLSQSRNLTYTVLPSANSGNQSGLSLLLSLENSEPSTWNWPESTLPVKSNQKQLIFYTWVGNMVLDNVSTHQEPVPHDQPAVLLYFVDYHMKNNYLPEAVHYVLISKGPLSIAENRLNIPTGKGEHDILAVRINYPEIPMCLLQGDRNGFGFPADPEIQRVSITVS